MGSIGTCSCLTLLLVLLLPANSTAQGSSAPRHGHMSLQGGMFRDARESSPAIAVRVAGGSVRLQLDAQGLMNLAEDATKELSLGIATGMRAKSLEISAGARLGAWSSTEFLPGISIGPFAGISGPANARWRLRGELGNRLRLAESSWRGGNYLLVGGEYRIGR
jgi:hypothetical protein